MTTLRTYAVSYMWMLRLFFFLNGCGLCVICSHYKMMGTIMQASPFTFPLNDIIAFLYYVRNMDGIKKNRRESLFPFLF